MEKLNIEIGRGVVVPLARDPDGNAIEIPEEAVGWRVRRHTGGRPRLQLDRDKQPMLFPLGYSAADVEDILPPGTYRLDLVNERGESLDLVIPIVIGAPMEEPEADDDEDRGEASTALVSTPLPPTTSDMRLVLEANVRSTQMAFVHNQRSLELGLRMAETLRDGVAMLAQAQADWIKTASGERGFFRNPRPEPAPVPTRNAALAVVEEDDEDEEDEDDEEDEYEEDDRDYDRPPRWLAPLMPVITMALPQVVQAITRMTEPKTNGADGQPARGGFSLGDLFKTPQKQAAPRIEPPSAGNTSLLEVTSPALRAKLMSVYASLSADDRVIALELIQAIAEDDRAVVVAELETMTPEEIGALIREQVGMTRAMWPPKDAPASGSGPQAAAPAAPMPPPTKPTELKK